MSVRTLEAVKWLRDILSRIFSSRKEYVAGDGEPRESTVMGWKQKPGSQERLSEGGNRRRESLWSRFLDPASVDLVSCVCSGFRRYCDGARSVGENNGDITGDGQLLRSNRRKQGCKKRSTGSRSVPHIRSGVSN